MKKIIAGLIAALIMAQSLTLFAADTASDAGEESLSVAAAADGTEMITSGDFSSDISESFSVNGTAQTRVYDDGTNNGGNPFLHIAGTRSSVSEYLQYTNTITLEPGTYVFSFDVRHGYDNEDELLGYFGNSYSDYREFTVKFELTTTEYWLGFIPHEETVGTDRLKEIFGGDVYESCKNPTAFEHVETHKQDPSGYIVFDEGTEYGYYSCLAAKKNQARAGSEWTTVTKTFVIDEEMTLKNIKFYGGDSKAVNLASYDIDNLSLKYLGSVSVSTPESNLEPVEGAVIKKGTATVDGNLDEAYLSSLAVNMTSANVSEWANTYWDGTANARTYYMYDDNYIYLFASVVDDDVIEPDEDTINGNVLLWNESTRSGYSPILDNDLFIWRLSLDGTPNLLKVAMDAYAYRVFGMEDRNGNLLGNGVYTVSDYDGILKAAKLTDFGYQIEVAIPCALGSANVLSAKKLGVALEIRDLDLSGEVGSESFAKAGKAYNTPIFFELSDSAATGAGSNYGDISGACGISVTWILDSDGVLTVNGYGAVPSYDSSAEAPWSLYTNFIKKLVIKSGITSIGENAFCDAGQLVTAEVADSVTYIGSNAFGNCTALNTVKYSGIEVEWNAIAKESTWDSGAGDYTVEFTGSTSASPTDGTCGEGLTWTYENGTLTINGTGAMTDYQMIGGAPWHDYSAYINDVIIADGVTGIGDYAFALCGNLTDITVPNSVTSIGKYAFKGCTSLASVSLSTGLTSIGEGTFENCSALTSIDIPGGVTAIGEDAFIGCGNLQSINVNASNTSYTSNNGVLYNKNMAALICYPAGKTDAEFTVPSGVTSVGKNAFRGAVKLESVTVSSGVTAMENGAFSGCTALRNVTVNGAVSAIDDYTFYYCTSLESITLQGSVTAIGKYAFANCRKLAGFNFNSVESIGEAAFRGCYALTAVKLSGNLTYIGGMAFSNCKALTDVYFENSRAVWNTVVKERLWDYGLGGEAYTLHVEGAVNGNCGTDVTWEFSDGVLTVSGTGSMTNYLPSAGGLYYDETKNPGVSNPAYTARQVPWYDYRDDITSVVIESGVTNVGDYAFMDFTSVTSITLADSVTSIGKLAFKGCSALTSVTIPGSVAVIGEDAFNGCSNLTVLNLSEGTTDIGDYAFYNCGIAGDLNLPESMINIGDFAFYSCDGIKTLEIKVGLRYIGDCAFAKCSGLEVINYAGTKARWLTVTDGNYWSYCAGCDTANGTYILNTAASSDIAYGYCGLDTAWALDENGKLTVMGDGSMADCSDYSETPWFDYIDDITSVTVEKGITHIGDFAFANLTNVQTVHYTGSKDDWEAVTKGSDWDLNTGSAAASGKYKLVIALSSEIAEGTLGENLEWVIANNGIFTISGAGAIDSFGNTGAPWSEYRNDIKSIVIGSGITSIGDFAFSGCKNAVSLTIGKDVGNIGKSAFAGCDKIASIEVDTDNTSYNSVDDVLYNGDMTTLIYYPGAKADTSFTVPAGVTAIASYAFRNCRKLVSVTIPDSVTTVGSYAFWGSEKIEAVAVGSGVDAIGSWAFAYCDSLAAIEVSGDNEKYTSIDGVLYSKDMKTLVSYPIGKSATLFAVPEGIKRISNYAFYGCGSLVTVTIPASVTTVGNDVFNYCGRLTAIEVDADNARYASEGGVLYNKEMTTLLCYPSGKADTEFTVPETVTSIGKSAFENCDRLAVINVGTNVTKIGYASFAYCDALSDINFAGTEGQWNEVTKGSYWNRYLDGDEVKFGA